MKKIPILGAIILIAGVAYVAYASSLGPNSPSTSGNDAAIGLQDWTNPNNNQVSDGIFATISDGSCTSVKDNSVKIIKGGTITGTDQTTNTNLDTVETYRSYGGATSLWGTTLTPTDINASNFGVGFSTIQTGC